jgi:adenine nucleotide transporter 17
VLRLTPLLGLSWGLPCGPPTPSHRSPYCALAPSCQARQRAAAARLKSGTAGGGGRAGGGPLPPAAAASAAEARSEAIGVAGSLLVAGLAGAGNVLATNPVS